LMASRLFQTYWNATFPALGPACRPRRFIASGKCWRTVKANCSTPRVSPPAGSQRQTVANILTFGGSPAREAITALGLNLSKRLVRSPKIYVRDSGIIHTLLGCRAGAIARPPIVGPSWEGFVIENLISIARAGVNAWFYRTSAGAEIDLLLELGPNKLWAVEVKRSLSNPHPTRDSTWPART